MAMSLVYSSRFKCARNQLRVYIRVKMMVTTFSETLTKPIVINEDDWLCCTDIYQHYQFRYPACFIAARWGDTVNLYLDPNTQEGSAASPWSGCRFFIQKQQPFDDVIDFEAYLALQDRQRGCPCTRERAWLTDLQRGYQGVRAIGHRSDGMMLSIILVSFQTTMIPIHAISHDGMDLDIKLARSVRFF